MAAKFAAFLAISAICSGGVHSVKIIQQNHQDVTVKEGDQVELICTSDVPVLACSFRSPGSSGTTYQMIKGASYDGRIVQHSINENDCGMKITDIQDKDNGIWECSITGKTQAGDFGIGTGNVQVIVAVPPSNVHLEMDGEQVVGPIAMNLDEERQKFVDCVATGARPAATFKWYIGTTLLNANIQSKEEVENGKKKYISTLEFNADPKHSGQQLKCEVVHMGYSLQAIEDESNWVKVDLNLAFKPQEKSVSETFYGMKEGTNNDIRIKFRANPRPSEGHWSLGGVSVPVGASSIDQKFTSSQFIDGDLEGEYVVELSFDMTPEMAGKPYSLEVTNNIGSSKYDFQLALSDQPPAEGASGPVIGIVILVIIILAVLGITVFARVKGVLCFAVKRKAQDDAERAVDKEGSDTESAEDTEAKKADGNENDVTDGAESNKKEETAAKRANVATRVSDFFAAVKKSVKKPKESKYAAETPESEMKLNEDKKDGDSIVYADLDRSALEAGSRSEVAPTEPTEYAEIKPSS